MTETNETSTETADKAAIKPELCAGSELRASAWLEELKAALRNAQKIRDCWAVGTEWWKRADGICVVLEYAIQHPGAGS